VAYRIRHELPDAIEAQDRLHAHAATGLAAKLKAGEVFAQGRVEHPQIIGV
jgi:hypothetical protein